MKTFDVNSTTYTVCKYPGYSLNEALRYWKAKFETVKHFKREVIKHHKLKEFSEFVEEERDSIHPVTVLEAFHEMNLEESRVMVVFMVLGNVFQEMILDIMV